MLSLRRGRVTAILEAQDGLVRLEVDGLPCVAYPRLTGRVEVGDDVVVNVQARELELGSGGFDVLHVNLTRGLDLGAEEGAHVMKLPYTSLQFARRHGEEDLELPVSLDGMPVVACSLHSQVAPVCAALRGLRVAYVQLEGGALPVELSDSLRELRREGLLETAIGSGACFGGDVDCVNVYSALVTGRTLGANVIVCAIGPGVVGTGTRLGHGGTAAAIAIAAARALDGRPVLAVRVSEGDPRERHRGVSHHSEVVLALSGDVAVASETDASGWREVCDGLTLRHMGRGPDDDPAFFAAAYAAGVRARTLLG
jgi:hypothetical protein